MTECVVSIAMELNLCEPWYQNFVRSVGGGLPAGIKRGEAVQQALLYYGASLRASVTGWELVFENSEDLAAMVLAHA